MPIQNINFDSTLFNVFYSELDADSISDLRNRKNRKGRLDN